MNLNHQSGRFQINNSISGLRLLITQFTSLSTVYAEGFYVTSGGGEIIKLQKNDFMK